MPLSLGILASGNGTNLQALIEAIETGSLRAKIKIVLSDQPSARALERAKKHGIDTQVVERKKFKSRQDFEDDLLKVLGSHGVEWVVLAGFMRILSPRFVQEYPNRILNIHPSLLPAFPGLNAIEQALKAQVEETGCTVHVVDEGCDTGPIIAQRKVLIKVGESLEELTERIHLEEHKLYVEVLREIEEGKILLKKN